MSDEVVVPPPATGVWYDPAAVRTDVLALLRLTEQDIDVARIEELIPAAANDIDAFVDRDPTAVEGPPPPPSVYQALIARTVALYRNKDAPFDVIPGTEPTDPLDPMAHQLLPHKQRWGIA